MSARTRTSALIKVYYRKEGLKAKAQEGGIRESFAASAKSLVSVYRGRHGRTLRTLIGFVDAVIDVAFGGITAPREYRSRVAFPALSLVSV